MPCIYPYPISFISVAPVPERNQQNGNVVILTTFLLLVASEIVKMKISVAASDENFFKWQHLHFSDSLTHWGRVTHICISNLTIIGSDNGLSPGRRQAIIWTNAGTLLIGPLRTNFSEISIKILPFSFEKMRLKVLSAKLRPFCLGLNVLMIQATNFVGWCRAPWSRLLFKMAVIWLFQCQWSNHDKYSQLQ